MHRVAPRPRRLAALIATALCLALVGPSPVLAEKGGGKPDWAGEKGGQGKGNQGKSDQGGQGPSKDRAPASARGSQDPSAVLAAGATAAVVSALLGGQTQPLMVGAKPLPPGIQKNLARGKPLPPGLARQSVPQPLLARLPAVDGHTWVRVGTELVLVGIATNLISQVIGGVFR